MRHCPWVLIPGHRIGSTRAPLFAFTLSYLLTPEFSSERGMLCPHFCTKGQLLRPEKACLPARNLISGSRIKLPCTQCTPVIILVLNKIALLPWEEAELPRAQRDGTGDLSFLCQLCPQGMKLFLRLSTLNPGNKWERGWSVFHGSAGLSQEPSVMSAQRTWFSPNLCGLSEHP